MGNMTKRRGMALLLAVALLLSSFVFAIPASAADAGNQNYSGDSSANGIRAYFNVSTDVPAILYNASGAISKKPALKLENKGEDAIKIISVAFATVNSAGTATTSTVLSGTVPTAAVAAGGSADISYAKGAGSLSQAAYRVRITYALQSDYEKNGASAQTAFADAYIGAASELTSASGTATSKNTANGIGLPGWYQAHMAYTVSGAGLSSITTADDSTNTKGGSSVSKVGGTMYMQAGSSLSGYGLTTKVSAQYANKVEIWRVTNVITGTNVQGTSTYYSVAANSSAGDGGKGIAAKTFNSNSENAVAGAVASYSKETNFVTNYSEYFSNFNNGKINSATDLTLTLQGTAPKNAGTYTLKNTWVSGNYKSFGNNINYCNQETTLTLNVYDKAALVSTYLSASKLGFYQDPAFSSTSTAFAAAMYTAVTALANQKPAQTALDSANTTLNTAATNVQASANHKAQYTVKHVLLEGDYSTGAIQDIAVQMGSTSETELSPAVGVSGWDLGTDYNRYTEQVSVSVNTQNRYLVTYYYWTVNLAELNGLLETSAEAYNDGENAGYTEESYAAFTDAYRAAQAAAAETNNVQADIGAAAAALKEAFEALAEPEPDFYTVRYYDDETKTEYEALAEEVDAGENAVRPADPEKEYKTFAGWFTEDGEAYDFDTAVTSNLSLYARFTDIAADWGKYEAAVTAWTGIDASAYTNYTEVAELLEEALAYGEDREGKTAANQETIDGYADAILDGIANLTPVVYLLSAEWVSDPVKSQASFFTVKTAGNVEGIVLRNGAIKYGAPVRAVETLEDGTKLWTLTVSLGTAGERDYQLTPVVDGAERSAYAVVLPATVLTEGDTGAADYSAIDAVEVPADLSLYTKESVAAMRTAKAAINLQLSKVQQAEVTAMIEAYAAAVDALELKPANTSKLTVAAAKGTAAAESGLYEDDEAMQALFALLEEADATFVITEQQQVDELVAAIYDAIRALTVAETSIVESITYASETNTNTLTSATVVFKDLAGVGSLAVVNESGQKIGAVNVTDNTTTVMFSGATVNANRNLKLYVLSTTGTTAAVVHGAIAEGNVVAVYDIFVSFA